MFHDHFGEVLDGFWDGFGRFLGGFGEGFGRTWELLGRSGAYFGHVWKDLVLLGQILLLDPRADPRSVTISNPYLGLIGLGKPL